MALRFYDEAVLNKIKKWVKDPNMHILGVNETQRLFQLKAIEGNDKPIVLPMIALSRDNDVEITSTAKRPLSYDGGHLNASTDQSEVLNGIPIKVSYQLDIYTKYFAEADEYMRNFVFNLINYPNITIEIPYNDAKVKHNTTIILEQTVMDNSNIPERLISGQFTRISLKFKIDDAYLFSVPFMDNWKMEYSSDIDTE